MGILEIVMFNIDKARSLTPRLATTLEQQGGIGDGDGSGDGGEGSESAAPYPPSFMASREPSPMEM